ncbi:MAG TPA: hypothetical protein VNW72_04955 [Chthoniobacterales bacterium]|jgi:hypothetical protein|nr:hypothetical protein [Chthoniobacterales bacterium]
MRSAPKIAGLVGILLLIWSAMFAFTFSYPFHWDDFHLIRTYSGPEILSVFHGVVDPDKIETPGLRPVSILLYNLQGTLWGENILLHRIFMLFVMALFLFLVGILLSDLGLQFFQIAIVLALFVSSRVFASLVLWVCLSHLILAYIFITLTALFFVRWIKQRRTVFFVLMLLSATVATFIREESYTLPVALPLIWLISTPDRARWRQVLAASLSLLGIFAFHYWLWHFFIPNALSPQFTSSAINKLLKAMASSSLPGGFTMIGIADKLIGFLWTGFLIALLVIFLVVSRPLARWQVLGICCLGALLSLPALGIARPFGIALPTLAFMTAVPIALAEIYRHAMFRGWQRYAVIGFAMLGLALGIVGGVHRSMYVAESLRENCAVRAERDGEFLFDIDHPATIPKPRREAGLVRLAGLGIKSADDVKNLRRDLKENRARFEQSGKNEQGLFLSKYEYLSF